VVGHQSAEFNWRKKKKKQSLQNGTGKKVSKFEVQQIESTTSYLAGKRRQVKEGDQPAEKEKRQYGKNILSGWKRENQTQKCADRQTYKKGPDFLGLGVQGREGYGQDRQRKERGGGRLKKKMEALQPRELYFNWGKRAAGEGRKRDKGSRPSPQKTHTTEKRGCKQGREDWGKRK